MTKKIHNYFFGSLPEMPWKEKKMNTKEKKNTIKMALKTNIDRLEVYQDKPWTFVKFYVFYDQVIFETFGFSKVCHPDNWDEEYGKNLAIDKALSRIAKRIIITENNK